MRIITRYHVKRVSGDYEAEQHLNREAENDYLLHSLVNVDGGTAMVVVTTYNYFDFELDEEQTF